MIKQLATRVSQSGLRPATSWHGAILLVGPLVLASVLGCTQNKDPYHCKQIKVEYRRAVDAIHAYTKGREAAATLPRSEGFYGELLIEVASVSSQMSTSIMRLEQMPIENEVKRRLLRYLVVVRRVFENACLKVFNRVLLGVGKDQKVISDEFIEEIYRANLEFERTFVATCKEGV